mgnify:CR=1 FL=1|jgi:hypothetical protein
MWWITLIIAAVLFIAFSAFLKLSYVKSYSGPMGELSLSIAQSYGIFAPIFKFSPNFLDIIFSLLYKLILFVIAALCVHFFDTIIIPAILYGLYLGTTVYMAIERRIQEKQLCYGGLDLRDPESTQKIMKFYEYFNPIKRAFLTLPVYHLILTVLLIVTYLLNK